MEGVAGTEDALRRRLAVRWMFGSSLSGELVSSRISFSVRPVYLNFVPQEKNPPPETIGASELLFNLKYIN